MPRINPYIPNDTVLATAAAAAVSVPKMDSRVESIIDQKQHHPNPYEDRRVHSRRVTRGRSETGSSTSSSECSERHVHWHPSIPDEDGSSADDTHPHLKSPPPPTRNRWQGLDEREMGSALRRVPSLKQIGGKVRELVARA